MFAESSFIKAIRTPNSIILLDELSRAHPDAWNILMTPLDPLQRYVRLDESEDSEVVPLQTELLSLLLQMSVTNTLQPE